MQRFERARIRGLRAGGREGQNNRVADHAEHREDARADDEEPRQDQHDPKDREAQIEAADKLAVGDEDIEAILRDRGGDGGENGERREVHHVAGDAQHHVRNALGHVDDGLRLLPERGQRDAEEEREHHDLQQRIGRHGVED